MSDTFVGNRTAGLTGKIRGGFGRNTPAWEQAIYYGTTLTSFREVINRLASINPDDVVFERDWNQDNPNDEDITWEAIVRAGGISPSNIPPEQFGLDKIPEPKFEIIDTVHVSDLLESTHPKVIELPVKVISAMRNAVQHGQAPEFLTNGFLIDGAALSTSVRNKATELFLNYMAGTRADEVLGQTLIKTYIASDEVAKKVRQQNADVKRLFHKSTVIARETVPQIYRDDMLDSQELPATTNGIRFFKGWKRYPAQRISVGSNINQLTVKYEYGVYSIYKDGEPL